VQLIIATRYIAVKSNNKVKEMLCEVAP